MPTFYGTNLREAIHNAVHQNSGFNFTAEPIEKKGRFQIPAPPLFWSPWFPIYSQFGVMGPNSGDNVTYVRVKYKHVVRMPSRFAVEIKGGDALVKDIGPGSIEVKISGNVATTLWIRLKSLSTLQNVIVSV